MGWFDGAGGAGCSCRTGEAFQIERDYKGFAFDAKECEVGGVRRAWGVGCVGEGIRDAGEEFTFELIAEGRDATRVFGQCESSEVGSFAEADDAGNIFGAGTKAALVMATVEKLAETCAAFD